MSIRPSSVDLFDFGRIAKSNINIRSTTAEQATADSSVRQGRGLALPRRPDALVAQGEGAEIPRGRTVAGSQSDERRLLPHETPAAREAGGVLEVRGYVRVRGIWRSRATRRRSRRAANFSTARRAAQTTRSIMINRRVHAACPRTFLCAAGLSSPDRLSAEPRCSHHGRHDDIFRRGEVMIAAIYARKSK